MPLIIFTGLPCSGKTRWAELLTKQLDEKIHLAKQNSSPGHNYKVIYHNDETLGIPRLAYEDSGAEKHARGTQLSAVKRDISRTAFVVLDSLAYIKGFRYQLFCEAKGVGTPHCIVHAMSPLETCIERNQARDFLGNAWTNDVITQLSMRYEEPNSETRWDSPLFNIVSDLEGETLPIDAIWESLVLKRPPPPNAATLVKPVSGNNYLQELDRRTLEVISKIVQHQQLTSAGGRVVIDSTLDLHVEVPLDAVSLAQLQRIRRAFLGLHRMRSIDVDRIHRVFVDYVNKSLNEGNE